MNYVALTSINSNLMVSEREKKNSQVYICD